jgi:2,3-diketo-5-methylthio-1-phosphopentane phosphatase
MNPTICDSLTSTKQGCNSTHIASLQKKIDLSKCRVFIDFDNTITSFDVLDDLIERFCVDDSWKELEERWRIGEIGSKECIAGQINSVRLSKGKFMKYLATIQLDRHFIKLLGLFREKKTEVTILSDSFLFIIRTILENHGVRKIKIYSNQLSFNFSRLIVSFPYINKKCGRCANCKNSHIQNDRNKNKFSIYIGDGLSDICPAQHSDMVFAKENLSRHFQKIRKPYIEFKHLGQVYNYLKEASQ